jgi:hypothetical protein
MRAQRGSANLARAYRDAGARIATHHARSIASANFVFGKRQTEVEDEVMRKHGGTMSAANRAAVIGLSIVSYVFFCGNRSNCDRRRETLQCEDLYVTVSPGTCVEITNPCVDHQWLVMPQVDGFTLCDQPAGITVEGQRTRTTTTRSICAAADVASLVNEPAGFLYGRGNEIGTGSVFITTVPPLALSASASPAEIDVGESSQLDVVVSGGVAPYSYTWTPSDRLSSATIANPTASPSNTTTYSVIVTDAAGQTATTEVDVTVHVAVVASAEPAAINPGESSQLSAAASGGTPPYSYTWTPLTTLNAPTTEDPIASPSRTTLYSVTVTDAAGLQAVAEVTVTVNLIVAANATPSSISAGSSAQLSVNVEGGTPPYSFSWAPADTLSASDVANPTATPETTTTYSVVVTDAAGTQAAASVTIEVSIPVLVLSAFATPAEIGAGGTSQLEAIVSGGISPYTYRWEGAGLSSTSIANPTASPAITTLYTLVVTDRFGQSASTALTVTVRLQVNATANPAVINPGQATQLSAVAQGGTPPYSCSWTPITGVTDPSAETTFASPLVTTTYTMTVTDASGAQASTTVTVRVNLTATAGANPTTINAGASSQLSVNVQGGTAPYTYSWTPATSLSASNVASPTATPGATTTYTVVVSDAAGAQVSSSVTITVIAAAPVLQADFVYVFDGRELITLDARRSTGDIVQYIWDVSWEPGSPDIVTTNPVTNYFAFRRTGTITLTVVGRNGTRSTATKAFVP